MKILATKSFESPINLEGSWGGYQLSPNAKSTMDLYEDDGTPIFIEWVVDLGEEEEVEHIGLELEGKNVVGYDGVMSIPDQAIQLLEEYGYNCEEVK